MGQTNRIEHEATAAPATVAVTGPELNTPRCEAAAYWEQRLSNLRGLDGVGFIGYGLPYNSWMYRIRKRVFTREIARLKLDLSRAAVLDVGSGTGFWIDAWRAMGVKAITASDFTNVATDNLRRKYPECRVVKQDITSPEAVEILGRKYDFVSAIDVLFHIVSDSAFSLAISNIAESLRSGGFFVFSENLLHRDTPLRSQTQVNRSIADLSQKLKQFGMQIVRRVPTFVVMNAPVDARSQFAPRLWRFCMAPVQFFPLLGHVYGMALYPIESVLTGLLQESPSTELVICQKWET
jgi:SAM-dependent methyltransferase